MEDPPESLPAGPGDLLVFVDETGIEDYSDLQNPTFGRGGCACRAEDYGRQIKKPWRKLKREFLGGVRKPFHATDFERQRPTMGQIHAINRFLEIPFWRFAAMSDSKTALPDGIDGHRAIALVTINFLQRLVQQHDCLELALVFESSGRGDSLVRRDFVLNEMNFV